MCPRYLLSLYPSIKINVALVFAHQRSSSPYEHWYLLKGLFYWHLKLTEKLSGLVDFNFAAYLSCRYWLMLTANK